MRFFQKNFLLRPVRFARAHPRSLLSGFIVLVGIYMLFLSPPRTFPAQATIVIPPGATLNETASQFETHNLVRSGLLLRAVSILFGTDGEVHAGEYQFDKPRGVLAVARAIMSGDFGVPLTRVTIPEGATARDIADLFPANRFPKFDRAAFIASAKLHEGYLFPDTYVFLSAVTSDEVLVALMENFDARITEVRADLLSSNYPLGDLVIMASLIEKEARSEEVRRTIAGILWKRLEIDMPLQVDAVFGYIKGTHTYAPSLTDLKIDSLYNTYLYKGLPPTAIGNPGLAALRAAANPIETPYLYYLTDRRGVMHYAVTHEEHVQNKEKYLK